MMTVLLVYSVLTLQSPTSKVESFDWSGTWVSTLKPAAGEAPMVWRSFTIQRKEAKHIVRFEGEENALPAVAFQVSKSATLLLIRLPADRGGARTVLLRPLDDGQVRLELLVEFPDGVKAESFYYSELYKRSR